MIGGFVDVRITDVFTNSLKGVVVRTEKDMGLRRDVSPQQILARQPKADPLGGAKISALSSHKFYRGCQPTWRRQPR